jgi:hypothetical protein
MEGENFVSLKGQITNGEFKVVGEKNSKLFKGKMTIPVGDKSQYIKVAAWREIAEGLESLPKNAFIHIHGHIEERSYDGTCRHCKGQEKKYWTEVVIDNFTQIG